MVMRPHGRLARILTYGDPAWIYTLIRNDWLVELSSQTSKNGKLNTTTKVCTMSLEYV